jgi:hypothetical protein
MPAAETVSGVLANSLASARTQPVWRDLSGLGFAISPIRLSFPAGLRLAGRNGIAQNYTLFN